jgi:hypothetical protein
MKRSLGTLLLAAALLPTTSCRKNETPSTGPAAASAARPVPKIEMVDPAGFSLSRGRVLLSTMRVTFSIAGAEHGTSAALRLTNPSLGVVAELPLNYVAHGEAEWAFENSLDLGPALRFRADCPNGYTDEFVLGRPESGGTGAVTQIRSLSPGEWKPPAAGEDGEAPAPSPIAVVIRGDGFHEQCRIQFRTGEADWGPLPTAWIGPGEMRTTLDPAAWRRLPVAARVLRLSLVVRGAGGDVETTRDLELWEP